MRMTKVQPSPRHPKVRYRVDYVTAEGARRRVIVGTKAEAEAVMGRLASERFETRFAGAKVRRKTTLAELRDIQLGRAAQKKSLVTDRYRWPAILDHFGPDRSIATITAADVIAFRAHLLAQPTQRGELPKPATVNRHLALLRTALGYAVESGLLASSPMPRGVMLAEANERDRLCTPEEMEKICAVAPADLRLATLIGYHSGCRLSEIQRLERADFVEADSTLRIGRSKTDRGRRKGRVVPVNATLAAILSPLPDGPLFTRSAHGLSLRFARLAEALGIDDLHFHDLRHTRATRLVRLGVDVFTLMRVMGWSNTNTAKRYVNTSAVDVASVLARDV